MLLGTESLDTFDFSPEAIGFLIMGMLVLYVAFRINKAYKRWQRKRNRIRRRRPPKPALFTPAPKEIQIQGVPYILAESDARWDYDRNFFGPPISKKLPYEKQSPRDAVLIRDGKNVKVVGDKIVRGIWQCPYSGVTTTNPQEVEVDHIVSLGEAWRHGASTWTPKQRHQFSRSTDNLVAVSKAVNRAKGDKDISLWLPRYNKEEYIVSALQVKGKFGLTLNRAQLKAVKQHFKV